MKFTLKDDSNTSCIASIASPHCRFMFMKTDYSQL